MSAQLSPDASLKSAKVLTLKEFFLKHIRTFFSLLETDEKRKQYVHHAR